jgi:hypothetical protein
MHVFWPKYIIVTAGGLRVGTTCNSATAKIRERSTIILADSVI